MVENSEKSNIFGENIEQKSAILNLQKFKEYKCQVQWNLPPIFIHKTKRIRSTSFNNIIQRESAKTTSTVQPVWQTFCLLLQYKQRIRSVKPKGSTTSHPIPLDWCVTTTLAHYLPQSDRHLAPTQKWSRTRPSTPQRFFAESSRIETKRKKKIKIKN